MSPPQHRSNTRYQLTAAEWLGQIIVGAHFQTDHAVDLIAFSRQHDDRNTGLRAQGAAERQPVFPGHHEIEQDEIDAAVGQRFSHGAAIGGGADAETFLAERAGDQVTDLVMVVDDQDMRRCGHGGIIEMRAG